MPASEKTKAAPAPAGAAATADAKRQVDPYLARPRRGLDGERGAHRCAEGLGRGARPEGRRAQAPAAARRRRRIAGVVLWLGEARAGDPMDRPELAVGALPGVPAAGPLPAGSAVEDAELAAVAWGLGAYRFRRYKSGNGERRDGRARDPARRRTARAFRAIVEAVGMGRDLINTPASDLGPEELEDAARSLAKRHERRASPASSATTCSPRTSR